MKSHVFVLFNVYLNCSDNPVFSPIGPADTIEGYRRQILNDPEQAFKFHTQEKELRYLGLYDDITGRFELLDEPQRLVELSNFFPKDFLTKKVEEKRAIEKKALDDYLALQKEIIKNGHDA